MGYFPATIAAALAGRVVRRARLVELAFGDGIDRYWEGTGTLVTADGKAWQGAGNLVEISAIESVIGGTAPQVTLALSGVDPALLPEVVAAETNVKGRSARIFLQFFDEAWQVLDAPYAIFLGIMDVLSIATAADGAKISLSIEGLFTRRGVPPWGYLSSSSQRHLYPGDSGLDDMAAMRNAQPHWPLYG